MLTTRLGGKMEREISEVAMTNQRVVLVERDGQVGVLTLNRPEARNALSAQLSKELREGTQELDEDPNINVIVVTGAGDKAFCAGADIKEMAQREQNPESVPSPARGDSEASGPRLVFSAKPTIGAINGVAIGGGSQLSTTVDIRIGCERSMFSFPGAAYGRINATWTLSRIVGLPIAKELLFSGRPIHAQEALSIGLLNRIVPSERLMEETMQLAHTIAGNPPEMVQAVKLMLNDYVGMRLEDMPKREQQGRAGLTTPPAKEVFSSFLNRS